MKKTCKRSRAMIAVSFIGILLSAVHAEENVPLNGVSVGSEPVESVVASLHHATLEELELWIEQLGSPQFRVRESATLKLSKCDSTALETLRKKADETTDQEIQSRCHAIASAIFDLDIGKRKSEFLKSLDASQTFGFGGWVPFSKIVGASRASKRLFAELVETYPELAQKSFENVESLTPIIDGMPEAVWQKFRLGRIELSDSVAMMYCTVRLNGVVPEDFSRTSLLLLRQRPFTIEVTRHPMRPVLRKLVGKWMEVTKVEQPAVLYLAMQNDIPESIPTVRKILSDRRCEPNLYAIAMGALMRFGSEEDLNLLADWREDTRLLGPPYEIQFRALRPIPQPDSKEQPKLEDGPLFVPANEKHMVELRYQDLALAASAKLTGRDDIPLLFPLLRTHGYTVFVPESLAFPQGDTEGRQKVIDLFRAK